MNYNPQHHYLCSIRLREYDYYQTGWYYVIICAYNKKCLFGRITNGKMVSNEFGKIVYEEWLRTKEIRRNIDLNYYIIMPNHIHGIIIIENKILNNDVGAIRRVTSTLQPNSLGAIIGQFKSIVTKRINRIKNTLGSTVWQRNYYEHILRNEMDLYSTRN